MNHCYRGSEQHDKKKTQIIKRVRRTKKDYAPTAIFYDRWSERSGISFYNRNDKFVIIEFH